MRACAKIILFGEHAVVYGYPGIAVPVTELFTDIEIEKSQEFSYTTTWILDDKQKTKLEKLFHFLFNKLDLSIPVKITIKSNIPIASGFGSSASLSVALIRTFSHEFGLNLDREEINKLAFECEKIFHGVPSGIDNTVIVYEQPIFYKDKKIEFLKLEKPFQLIIANSGIKTSTKETVDFVRREYKKNKEKYTMLFTEIGKIAEKAKEHLKQGNFDRLGELMSQNHLLLKEIGVSCEKLEDMVKEALLNGAAYGSKLAGSGKGGNMIALARDKESLVEQLSKISDEIIISEIK